MGGPTARAGSLLGHRPGHGQEGTGACGSAVVKRRKQQDGEVTTLRRLPGEGVREGPALGQTRADFEQMACEPHGRCARRGGGVCPAHRRHSAAGQGRWRGDGLEWVRQVCARLLSSARAWGRTAAAERRALLRHCVCF